MRDYIIYTDKGNSYFHNYKFYLKFMIGPNKLVCPWQTFKAYCNVTLWQVGPFISFEKMKDGK